MAVRRTAWSYGQEVTSVDGDAGDTAAGTIVDVGLERVVFSGDGRTATRARAGIR